MSVSIDWLQVLVQDTPIVELVVRVSIVYLFLYFLLRFVLKREAGAIGLTDVLVIVLIADAVQNGMAGQYDTVFGALVLGSTLVFWDYALSWLAFQSPRLRRLIRPGPLLLIKNGRIIERNLRSELITREELMGQLRLQGIETVDDVWEAYMEEDGRFSIIEKRWVQKRESHRSRAQRKDIG